MKAMQRTALMLALAGALSMPAALLAADVVKDEHSGHHPEAAQAATATATPTAAAMPADLMPAMRDRMRLMRQIQDPEKRMEMMNAQMKDLETMMQGPKRSCPKADAKGGMGMMGGGMGMMGGKCGKGMMGQGMQGGMGMSGQDDRMAKRMEMMEKRLDMMQMMMQMRMQGMGGGMGPGMQGGMGMPSN